MSNAPAADVAVPQGGFPASNVPPTDAEFLNLHEFIKAAKLKLNQYIWDYLVGGTETETTLRRNRLALDSMAFRPRVLVDTNDIDSSHSFFGRKIRLPVALGPVGSLESFEPGGGATVAQGAGAFGVPMFCSSVTQPGLEQVGEIRQRAEGVPALRARRRRLHHRPREARGGCRIRRVLHHR